jgi:hypothetical protein
VYSLKLRLKVGRWNLRPQSLSNLSFRSKAAFHNYSAVWLLVIDVRISSSVA